MRPTKGSHSSNSQSQDDRETVPRTRRRPTSKIRRPPASAALGTVAREAARHAQNALSPATQSAYAADWRDFDAWCRSHNLGTMPATPKTVGLYLTARARTRKVATLKRRLAAIARQHRRAGAQLDLRHPEIHDVLAGIKRQYGSRSHPKDPLSPKDIRSMLRQMPGNRLRGWRDRALLLIGFAGALRRSELVALDVEMLHFTSRGVAITIPRSKTDPYGEAETIGIPFGRKRLTCPVVALRRWIRSAPISEGPVFRHIDRHERVLTRLSGRAVARIVQRYAEEAEIDADVAAHSLRSGFATTAAAAGCNVFELMQQTRHRSVSTARLYVRAGNIFRNRAVRALRL